MPGKRGARVVRFVEAVWSAIYAFAWFVGVGMALVLYAVLTRRATVQ